MKKRLSKDVDARFVEVASAGRAAWLRGDLLKAEEAFMAAWDLIPEPKLEHDRAQSAARGFVTFFRDTGQFDKAREWLATTSKAYNDPDNPSVAFLAGTVAFEAGDREEAFRFFDRLYREFGERPFEGTDKKYLAFYRARSSLS